MRKRITFILFACCICFALVPNQSFAWDAKLIGIEYYKGDDGKKNQCSTNSIMVTEVYELNNVDLQGVKYYCQTGDEVRKPRGFKSKRKNGHITVNTCVSKGTKFLKTVWFTSKALPPALTGTKPTNNIRTTKHHAYNDFIIGGAK